MRDECIKTSSQTKRMGKKNKKKHFSQVLQMSVTLGPILQNKNGFYGGIVWFLTIFNKLTHTYVWFLKLHSSYTFICLNIQILHTQCWTK